MDGKWMNTLIKGIVDHPKCKYMKNLQIKSDKNGKEMQHTVRQGFRPYFTYEIKLMKKMLHIELKYI